MYFNKIFQTFLNPKGKITANNYLSGILLAVLYPFLEGILSFRAELANMLADPIPKQTSDGLMGLLDMFSESFSVANVYGMNLINIKEILTFLVLYIVFVVTFKRCTTLDYEKTKCYVLSVLACFLFWALSDIIKITGLLLYDAPVYAIDMHYLLLPLIGFFVVFLTDKTVFRSSHIFVKLLWICIVFAVLRFIAGVVFTKASLPNGSNPYLLAMWLLLIVVFINQMLSSIKFIKNKKIWIIFFGFITVCVVAAYISARTNFNDSLYLVYNTFLEFIDIAVLLSGLLLILLSTIDDREQDALNEKRMTPWFSNSIMDLLFNFRGTIGSREYRAMLVLVFIGVNAYFIPELLKEGWLSDKYVELLPFSSYTYHPVNCFYALLMLYSSFVLSVKRARSKSLPMAWGWITGVFTYLMFWSWQQLMTISRYRQMMEKEFLFFHIAMLVIGVVCIIILSIRYKNEQKITTGHNNRFTGIDYLMKYFVLSIAVAIIMVVLVLIVANGQLFLLLELLLWSTFLGISIYFSILRAKDAKCNIGWIFAAYGLLLVLGLIYYFSGLAVMITIVQYILLLRFGLVALPSEATISNNHQKAIL